MARKEKRYHYLYKTINILTKRYYYGMHSTDNLDDGYLGSGKRLRYSINKYGKENHQQEIIKFCPNRNSLKKSEYDLVNLNEVAKKDCMNLRIGGEGGFSHEHQIINSKKGNQRFVELLSDDEWRKTFGNKISIILKKYFKNHDGNWKNKKHTKKTKQKMSKSHKGNGMGSKNSQYNTCWITNGIENKKIKKNIEISNSWRHGRVTI